jgi:molybdopterin-guanine dinucleotide biosynthesis protein A
MERCERPQYAAARRAGFVLVGGQSSRMGRDKALLPYGGSTMASHVAFEVKTAAGSAVLVGDPKRYGGLGYPVVPDLRPGWGPLAGIEAALGSTGALWNLVAACDMPRLSARFLRTLLERAEGRGGLCTVPVAPGGGPEPLCAVWRSDALPVVAAALDRGVRKMAEALEIAGAAYWPVDDAAWFENWNEPEDRAGHSEASL